MSFDEGKSLDEVRTDAKAEEGTHRMSDREMLFLAYGALKALGKAREVTETIEAHLYPDGVKS